MYYFGFLELLREKTEVCHQLFCLLLNKFTRYFFGLVFKPSTEKKYPNEINVILYHKKMKTLTVVMMKMNI